MPVLLLLPLALILYFYLDRRAIRSLEASLKEKPEIPMLLQLAAKKAALDLIRDVAWVSLIVFGAAVAITLLAGVVIRVNAQNAREALSYLGPVAAKIREWKSHLWIGTGAFSLATVLFAWIRFRTLEKQMADRLAKMYAAEIERLHEQQMRGEWEILPPTDDMQELIDVLDRRGDRLSPDQRERVLATIVQMDYERRMQLDWDELWNPKKEMEARPSDLSGRIVRFLSGKTPLKAWKTGQRWVSLAATGCWLLAAIGIGANGGVLPAVQERFVTAWDVVVAHNGEASGEDDRKEERSTPASNTPVRPGPQDTERINRLARQFERAATQSRSFWEQPHREAAYQQREVREFILRSAEQVRPESHQAAQAMETAAAEAAPEGIRAQVNVAEAAVRETGPRTELGRMFRDHVLKQAARNPERWARWQARMASGGEFLRYSGLNNAGEAILGEAWGQAMGAAGDLPYLAKELTKKVPKAVLEKAYQQKAAAMESALDGRFSFGEAFARVSEAAWRDPVMPWRSAEQMREWTASAPSEEAVIENLAKRPPYMRARPVAETSNATAEAAAEKLAGTLSKWSGSTRHRTIAETLVVYDDWLMPRGDGAPATLRTAFLKKSPAPLTAEEVSNSYSAARSFQSLRGFSRVGGIMIGRDAPSQARDSFADLRWSQEGTGLRLLLVRRDGSSIRSRAFDPQVVRAALAYAADGRPIAVTIMNATQLERRRILLHPAVDQTALGRDLIAADGWIFHKKDPTRMNDVMERAEQDTIIYGIAWRHRLMPLIKPEHRAGFEQEALTMETEHPRLALALARSGKWSEKAESPLGASEKGFDPELVKWMQTCASSKANLGDFGRCIQTAAEGAFPRDSRSDSETTWKRWTAAPPESQSMSHIREQTFELGGDLAFLGERGRERSDEFEYLIQTTFGAGESFVDADPWSHPVLREEAAAAIREQMADPENQRIMRALMDFRDAQRLFRAVLTGRLGEHFPIGRLADLMSAIPSGPRVKTADWEPLGEAPGAGSQVERSMISRIEELLKRPGGREPLDPRVRSALEGCRAALRRDLAGTSTSGACNLTRVEDAATGDEARAVVRGAIRLEYARELRAALGAARN